MKTIKIQDLKSKAITLSAKEQQHIKGGTSIKDANSGRSNQAD